MTDAVKLAIDDYYSREGMTPHQVASLFSSVAGVYDETWKARKYTDPEFLSTSVADYFGEEKASSLRVLDIGSGTGMVAEELRKRGIHNIDGLDPSKGMRDEAMKKNVYRNYYLEFMDGHYIEDIGTDAYDCVVAAGTFNSGLLPCAALPEMIRAVKPGGLMCFGIFDSVFSSVPEYKHRLGPLMSRLEEQGAWKLHDKVQRKDSDMTGNPETVYRYVIQASEVHAASVFASLPVVDP
ncbi:uncharacterized protein LOC124262456 [Haliotis rubra]|uniref:uncharacterized protein LOC124262456 n=1 Tax=Haliotis rubra TaxID=36100 RepID=UPI001EE57A70|nr:uncharacterized protein LOC124262456 [Haliotis rubra]